MLVQVDLEPTGKLHVVIDLNGCLTRGLYALNFIVKTLAVAAKAEMLHARLTQ